MKLDANATQLLAQDARYQDIGNLPSNFYPYDFKKLMIRPFTVNELKLVSKASVLNDSSHMLRAVDLVIDQDINEISIGDYYYLLMWLKINSAPKTPYVVDWHCPERMFKNKMTGAFIFNDDTFAPPAADDVDEEGKSNWEIVDCGTHNTELVHMTTIDILQLPEEGWEPLEADFDFPRVRNYADIREGLKDPELTMILPAAQWIAGKTLADKIKRLEEEPTADLLLNALALNKTIVHGISETATLHCRGCRSEYVYNIDLEPASFFR